MLVALVGEAPNDTLSIKNILGKVYQNITFESFLDDIHGSQIESQKTKRFLRIEYELKKPDLIIFIRDLDTLENNAVQLELRKQYFRDFNTVVDKKGIYLLNIFEIEALILADIACFNKIYESNVSAVIAPMKVEQPKEFLKLATRKSVKQFNESHNSDIFNSLDFDIVKANCRYFDAFIKNLDKEIAAIG